MAYARTSWVWVAAGAGVLLIAAWWVSAVWHDPTVADPAPYILSAMERCYSSSKQSPCYRDAAKDFVAKFSPAAIATVFIFTTD